MEHMSQGYSLESFAGVIGVCRQTLYNWRDAQPEFLDTIKKAKESCLNFWERQGLTGMYQGGKDFSSAIWIFNMKARFGWKDVQSVEHSGPDGKPIETKSLSNLSDEQLDALVAQKLALVKATPNND